MRSIEMYFDGVKKTKAGTAGFCEKLKLTQCRLEIQCAKFNISSSDSV